MLIALALLAGIVTTSLAPKPPVETYQGIVKVCPLKSREHRRVQHIHWEDLPTCQEK